MKTFSKLADDSQKQTRPHTASIFAHATHAAIALVLFAGCAESTVADDESDPASVLNAGEAAADDDFDKTLAAPTVSAPADAGMLRGEPDASSSFSADAGNVANDDRKAVVSLPALADAGTPGSQPDAGATLVSAPSTGGSVASHYQVKNGLLYDGCGKEFVMRGVNHPTIYTDRAGAAFPEIARTGANTVRMFWFGTHGISINELEPAIEKSVENGMVPMIEMHDSTCAWNVNPIIDQWLKPEAVALIKKHEKHLIVNIANEASPPNAEEFAKVYKSAISRMRAAGIHVPLVIDGGRCGRDFDVLFNKGKELLDADPDHNLIFSAHIYDPLTPAQMAAMFAKARMLQLPFILGEFANREPPGCGKNIDYATLITEANKSGIGWLAWSWGDNDANKAFNTDCGEFDMTKTFAFDSLEGWGKDVSVNHAASIQKTSKRPYSLTHGDMCE